MSLGRKRKRRSDDDSYEEMPKALTPHSKTTEDMVTRRNPDVQLNTASFLLASVLPGLTATGTFVGALLTDVLVAGLTFGLNSFLGPSKPNFGGSGDFEQSRTFGFDNIETSFDPIGESIPIIYGTLKQGGQRIQSFVNQQGENQFLHMLILVGEGEMDNIRDVEVDEQPVDNFDGVTITKRFGTPDQQPIPNLTDQVNQSSLNQAIKSDSWVTFTTQQEVDEVALGINYNQGLFEIKDNGDLSSTSVSFTVQWRKTGTNGWPNEKIIRHRDKLRATVRRENIIDFDDKDVWDIRIQRNSQEVPDTQTTDFATLSFIKERIIDTLRYPNMALLGVKIKASDQLSGVEPNITFIVDGKRLDPEKFPDELLQEKKWSDNPYLAIYDVLTTNKERGGAGMTPARILGRENRLLSDWVSARDHANQQVDDGTGEGTTHKRHSFNFAIDQDFRVNDFLTHVSNILDGFFLPVGDGVKPIINKQDEDIIQIFTEGKNIESESISWQYVSKDQRFNSIKGEILDEDEGFERVQLTIPKEDEFTGDQLFPQQDISMAGISRKAEAFRLGRRKMIESNQELLITTFSTPIESVFVQPGDLAKISHFVPTDEKWGDVGGKLDGWNDEGFIIDQNITLPETDEQGNPKDYNLTLMLEDGTFRELRVDSQSVGKENQSIIKTITSPAELTKSPQENSPYTLGELNQEAQTIRILDIGKTDKTTAQVTAISHYENKFDQLDNFIVSDESIEILDESLPPQPVENLVVEEELVLRNGQFESDLHLFWTPPDQSGVDHFEIFWDDDVNDAVEKWNNINSVTGNELVFQNGIVGQTNGFKVQTVLESGSRTSLSNSPTVTIQPEGESANPPDVENFQVQSRDGDIRLTWKQVNIPDLAHYEIRKGSSWTNSTLIDRINSLSLVLDGLESGSHTFFIKAVDQAGNKSQNASSDSITVFVGSPKNLSFEFKRGDVIFDWDAPDSNFEISHYEIREETNAYDTATFVSTSTATKFRTPVDWNGDQNWWFQTVDQVGNRSNPQSIMVEVSLPEVERIRSRLINNNVLLNWDVNRGSLPIDQYEIRKGPTFSESTVIGTSQSTFSNIVEDIEGQFTYWIVPIDTAGNEGVKQSTTLGVSPPPAFQLFDELDQDFSNPSLLFNGSSDTVQIPHIPEYEAHPFSVGVRFVADAGTLDGTVHQLVQHGINSAGFDLRIQNNQFEFRVGNGSSYQVVQESEEIAERKVYFFVGTFDGSDMTLWKQTNNLEEPVISTTTTISGNYSPSTDDFFVGSNQNQDSFFDGIIDDVQLWTRELSGQDVLKAFNLNLDRTDSDLVGLFPSDDPFGRQWVDESPQGNHGSITGASWTAFHDDKSNTIISNKIELNEERGIIGPVNADQTWKGHFEDNSWNTPQDQINAGHEIYQEPASGTGIFDEIFDLGTTIASSTIETSIQQEIINGSPNRSVELGVKNTITGTWDFEAGTQRSADNFQFVRTRVLISGTRDDLLEINEIKTRVSAQTIIDNFRIQTNANDTGGTTVEFRRNFLDITSLTATPKTNNDWTAVVDFNDSPEPQSFQVFLFNENGNRETGEVSIHTEGFIIQ